jgi:hypothetical protein
MVASLPLILGFQMLLQALTLDVQNIPKVSQSPRSTLRKNEYFRINESQ